MVFDLRNIPSVIPNLADHGHRREHMATLLTRLGMPHVFVPGVTKFGKKKNVAAAYAAGFEKMGEAPFIIFDDDQELLWDDCVLPYVPDDADIIYLTTHPAGCLPGTQENIKQYGLHAYDGLTLAEVYDETYLRLYSMITSMAILILTQRGRDRFRLELKKAFNRETAADIRYAFAMPELNVYAVRQPMFAEKQSLQVPSKSSDARSAATHTPLVPVSEGDIRIARHRHRKLAVRAVRDDKTKALNWHVLQAVGPNDPLTPLQQDPIGTPNYNTNILKDRIDIIENARVFPLDPKTGSCGVTDELGQFSRHSLEYRWVRRAMPAPEVTRHSGKFARLEGTYLYGGWLHPHFGHFLAESTTRLWALGEDHGKVDGVIFIPYGPKTIWRTRKAYMPILKILAGDVPIIAQTNPAIVERLIVPEPGFGHRARMGGSDKYISFVRQQVAAHVTPDGPERLYISRSALGHKRGGIFGERALENYLADNGYEVFHPQRHSAEVQLARYRAAKKIVSLDGSPLHFAAFAMGSDAEVAVIKRRVSDIPQNMAKHIKRFSGADATVIDAIEQMWVNANSLRADYSSYGQLDMPKVSELLVANGFCDGASALAPITRAQIEEELSQRPADASALVPLPDA